MTRAMPITLSVLACCGGVAVVDSTDVGAAGGSGGRAGASSIGGGGAAGSGGQGPCAQDVPGSFNRCNGVPCRGWCHPQGGCVCGGIDGGCPAPLVCCLDLCQSAAACTESETTHMMHLARTGHRRLACIVIASLTPLVLAAACSSKVVAPEHSGGAGGTAAAGAGGSDLAGSDAGERRAAIAYTVLGSCRLAGVDPREDLADVLPKLARRARPAEAAQLLPAAWRDRRAAELTETAAHESGAE